MLPIVARESTLNVIAKVSRALLVHFTVVIGMEGIFTPSRINGFYLKLFPNKR